MDWVVFSLVVVCVQVLRLATMRFSANRKITVIFCAKSVSLAEINPRVSRYLIRDFCSTRLQSSLSKVYWGSPANLSICYTEIIYYIIYIKY